MRRVRWLAAFGLLAVLATVRPAVADAPKVSLVANGIYPDDKGDYTLTFQGAGTEANKPTFKDRTATAVRFGNAVPLLLAPCPPPPVTLIPSPVVTPAAPVPVPVPSGCLDKADTTFRTLSVRVHNIAAGPGVVSLFFGDDVTDPPVPVLVSPYTSNLPRITGGVATIGLLVLLAIILSQRDHQKLSNGKRVHPLAAMFIDRSTSTYSLSKVQLYAWMIAGISTYLYLLSSKVLVQGIWALADVPSSVVGVAGISLATTVVSTGINTTIGGPGSSEFDPTLSDLIASGGDIAPERVQQLLWTVLAAPAFVLFAYMADPATMQTVQDVPSAFLQLMGVSAVGYLGGKVARGAGPKVTNVTCVYQAGPPPLLTISVAGSDIQTHGAAYYLRDLAVVNAKDVALPTTLLDSSKVNAQGLATALDLSVPAAGLRTAPNAAGSWQYKFILVTTDGERAEWDF